MYIIQEWIKFKNKPGLCKLQS